MCLFPGQHSVYGPIARNEQVRGSIPLPGSPSRDESFERHEVLVLSAGHVGLMHPWGLPVRAGATLWSPRIPIMTRDLSTR